MPVNFETVKSILREYSEGKKAMALILEQIGIHPFDFFHVLEQFPELKLDYERAQIYRVEIEVDELTTIADTEENPAKARNRIDVRKWKASKMNPAKYGDRLDINISKTVDIVAAIAEGRSRMLIQHETRDEERVEKNAMIPMCDPQQVTKQEAIDITDAVINRATGFKPLDQDQIKPIEAKDASQNEDDDIFS